MFIYQPTGETLKINRHFFDENGRRHAKEWFQWSAELKASVGIVEQPDVQIDPKPDYDPDTQRVIEGDIETRDGVEYQTWTVIDRPAEAIANDLANKKAQVRAQRNARLAETDWSILPDSPLSDADKTIYQNYRTALRDVPAQDGFPNNALPKGPDEQPYASWTYDSTAFVWNAPLPKPDGEAVWDEDAYQEDNTTGWILLGS